MTRSFKDAAGVTWTVPHQVYELSRQQEALAAAGLTVETVRGAAHGHGTEYSEAFPGSEQAYRQWYGVQFAVVLIVRAVQEMSATCPAA